MLMRVGEKTCFDVILKLVESNKNLLKMRSFWKTNQKAH